MKILARRRFILAKINREEFLAVREAQMLLATTKGEFCEAIDPQCTSRELEVQP
jgi:hypothetical protein